MKRVSTKEAIVITAIELFNEKGTAAVSTNRIAEAMGISPGNLYYHFRNKEEIIHGSLLVLRNGDTEVVADQRRQADRRVAQQLGTHHRVEQIREAEGTVALEYEDVVLRRVEDQADLR